MRNRSGFPQTEEQVAALSLSELNDFIRYLEFLTYEVKRSSSLKKQSFKSLIWLENCRETLHGVPAPDRKRL